MSDISALSTPQKTTPRVRLPIRAKITIPYFVLSLIVAVAAAFLITQLVIENVEERFNKQLFEAGKISSELVVTYENQLLETQRLLANVQGVSDALQTRDANELRSLTLGIIANDGQEAVEFLDLQGNHVLSVRRAAGANPEEYSVSTGGLSQFSELELVRAVLNRQTDARGDKFAGHVATEVGDFLYVAGPIFDPQGTLVGVVLVGRSLPTLAADIRFKTFAQVSLYAESGQVLYSTLPFPHDLDPGLAEQAQRTGAEGSLVRDLDVTNIPYSEILGAWVVRGDQRIGVLGVALSKNAVVQTSSASRWQIFLLVTIANFLIILVGINLANRITHPLLQLMQASVQVTEGNLNVRVEPQSNDEITVLTESFNAMVASLNQSQRQLLQTYDDTLEGWAKALELRDKETEGHSERVTELTVRLGAEMGLGWEELIPIRRGALLHDIGKMGTPDAILHKEGPLTVEERRIIQRHPQDAYDMLSRINFLKPSLEIPYCHHEKWDGSGYPRGLKGEAIPLSARMFAIVDVYDALTNDRPYRKALPRAEVLQYLRSQSGTHFDPQVVEAFIRLIATT